MRTNVRSGLFGVLAFAALPALAAPPGVVVVQGDVPAIAELEVMPARAVLAALSLVVAPKPPAPLSQEQRVALTAAVARFEVKGDVPGAIAAIAVATDALPNALLAEDERALVKALWLLGQLHLLEAKNSRGKGRPRALQHARAALERSVRVAPEARPTAEHFPPDLIALHGDVVAAAVTAGTTLHVKPGGSISRSCSTLVDGVARGRVGAPVGPFARGRVVVAVACAGSDAARPAVGRSVLLDRPNVSVAASDVLAHLRVVDERLYLSPTTERAVVDQVAQTLLAESRAPWAAVLQPAKAGQLIAIVFAPGGGAPRLLSDQPPAALAAQLRTATAAPFDAGVTSIGAPAHSERRARWWHWMLLGTGVALVGAGGGVHGFAVTGPYADTNAGTLDERDRLSGLQAGYGSLYGVGGALTLLGAILASVGTTR